MATSGGLTLDHFHYLDKLAPEMKLRVLSFADVKGICSLAQSNKWWNNFIDKAHTKEIYTALYNTLKKRSGEPVSPVNDLAALRLSPNLDIAKARCKYRVLLDRNLLSPQPVTTELAYRPSATLYGFETDYQNRIIIWTSVEGSLHVVDMDTRVELWSVGRDDVRPNSHIFYRPGSVILRHQHGDSVVLFRELVPGGLRSHDYNRQTLQLSSGNVGTRLRNGIFCIFDEDDRILEYDVSTANTEPTLLRTTKFASPSSSEEDDELWIIADEQVLLLRAAELFLYDLSGNLRSTFQLPATYADVREMYTIQPTDRPLGNRSSPTQLTHFEITKGCDSVIWDGVEYETGVFHGGIKDMTEDIEWIDIKVSGDLMVLTSDEGQICLTTQWKADSAPTTARYTAMLMVDTPVYGVFNIHSITDTRITLSTNSYVCVITLKDDYSISSTAYEPYEPDEPDRYFGMQPGLAYNSETTAPDTTSYCICHIDMNDEDDPHINPDWVHLCEDAIMFPHYNHESVIDRIRIVSFDPSLASP